jgi:transposase-like protein
MSTTRILPEKIHEYNFTQLFKSSTHPRERNRFLAFSRLQEGKTPREVAAIVRVTRNTVYQWMRNFDAFGIEGLREKPGRGKKPLIVDSEREAFRRAVLDLQEGRSGGGNHGKRCITIDEREIWCRMFAKECL